MMENWRVVLVSVVIIGMLSLVVMGLGLESPKLHKVGGSKGWHPDVNYTQWSAQEHVYVGDWLLFRFDIKLYNVLEVNKTSYEKCIEREFIKNMTRGGRDVVELREERTYYYLSSGGYCFHGMRVTVKVQQHQHQHQLPVLAPSFAFALASAPSPTLTMVSSGGSLLPTCIWIIIIANML